MASEYHISGFFAAAEHIFAPGTKTCYNEKIMDYFGTSSDLFFFVLTVVIAVLGVLLAWLLYYLVMIIRQAHKTVQGISATIDKIQAMIQTVQDAAARSSTGRTGGSDG